MNFADIFNYYMDKLKINSKELSELSKISSASISRYKNSERIPNSDQLDKIIEAFSQIAKNKNMTEITEEKIKKDFKKVLDTEINLELFRTKLSTLIDCLEINITKLSKYINYDASYLTKIKNGNRNPKNVKALSYNICKYICDNYNDINSKNKIISILNCDIHDIVNNDNYFKILSNYLCDSKSKTNNESVSNFLLKLDSFDLNEYIKAIKFDKLKVITIPKTKDKEKFYYGLDGFKKAQLDALRTIIFSKKSEDITFYSNMSMIEASKDISFTKKFMISLAFILKKGLKLNIIHNLDRPFEELMLGLEGWIPLYMTGQINPYYFKELPSKTFRNLECSNNVVSLSGSYSGNISNARFYLSTKGRDIENQKNKIENMMQGAMPLMKIYNQNNKNEFNLFLKKNQMGNFDKVNMLTNLPVYCLSDELINEILDSNNIDKQERKIILNYIDSEKTNTYNTLRNNKIYDQIYLLTKEEFDNYEYSLPLSMIFIDKKIKYTYDQYLKHLDLIKEFKKNNKNYEYTINENLVFNNINIYINKSNQKFVIISKENAPSTHFVIHNPTLINAIENFDAPIKY